MATMDLKVPLLSNLAQPGTTQEIELKLKANPNIGDLFTSFPANDSRNDIQTILKNLMKMKPDEIPIPFKGNCLALTKDKSSFVFCSVEGRLGICNRLTKEVTNDVKLSDNGLYALALFNNDQYVFVGGKDAVIFKYRLSDFKLVKKYQGHNGKISEIFFSNDEKNMFTCSDDKTVRIWDMSDGSSEIIYSHTDRSLCMSVAEDEEWLATGGADKKVYVYDLKNRNIIQTLEGPTNSIWSVQFSKSRSMLAAGDNDAGCFIWDCKTWTLLRKLEGHEERVSCIEFLDNEKVVITASNDKTVRIWSLDHDRREIVYTGHKNWIKSMMLSDDKRSIYTTSEDCRILVWKVPVNLDDEWKLTGHTENVYNCLYSPKRDLVFTNANDKKAIIWDPIKKVKIKELVHEAGIYAMTLTQDENYLITCTSQKQMTMWSIDTYEPFCINELSTVTVKAVCCTPDGKYYVTGDTENRITVTEYRDPSSNQERPVKYVFRKHKNTVWSLATTHDSSTLITGGEDGSIVLYDLNIGAEKGQLLGHTKKIKCLAVSRNDEILISGSWDATFKIWSINKLFLYKSVTFHTGAINGIYFSKDQEYFIIASTDQKVSFWNYHDFSYITHSTYGDLCLAVNCSPDEKTLFVVEKSSIFIQDNPMCTSKFGFFGPERSSQGIIEYISKLINAEEVEHNPEMDKWLISPMRMNAVHLYAYFNLPVHLKQAFSVGSPIYNSSMKRNALSLCIERDFTDCANIILNSLEKKVKESPYSLYLVEDLFIQLNQKGYANLNEFYNFLLIPARDITLPKFIDPLAKLPVVLESSTKEVIPDKFALKEMYKNEGKSIQFWESYAKLDTTIGSEASVNFLQSLMDCPNPDVFRTRFIKVILNQKWETVRWIMRLQGFVYGVYLLLLSIYTTNYLGSVAFLAPIFVINLFLLAYETFQMSVAGLEYWSDVWNYLDLTRSFTCVVYSILLFLDVAQDANSKIFVFLTLLSWIRGISYFRLFEKTRYLIALISEVFSDMTSFLALLFYSTIAFSLIFVAITKGEGESFGSYLTISYRIDLGDFDTAGYSGIDWIIFFLASVINPLIMLNLLISIMGDTYDRVQDGREISDLKELAEMILEAETLLYWKRGLGQALYVQVLSEQEQTTEVDSWLGKVRELKLKLTSIGKAVNSASATQLNDMKRLENKVDTLRSADKEEVLGKIEEMNKNFAAFKEENQKQLAEIKELIANAASN